MSNTLYLDGRCYETPREMHTQIAQLLEFPDYYGKNADALYDELSGRSHLPAVTIVSLGTGEVAAELRRCIRVFLDLECPLTIRGGADCQE